MADRETGGLPGSKFWLIACSLAISAAFVLSLCLAFDARWETNDDVAMSMVAHGYGVAAFGSPNLIFSNILWGHLVRAVPQINGILGYSIVTLSVLVIVGAVLVFGLFRLGSGYIAPLGVLALLMVRPVLFPQFTINAGLLMVAAVICIHLFARRNDPLALLIGCLFAFASFLVRRNEFFLVFIVALPLLPWGAILRRRSSQFVLLALIVVMALSTVVDRRAYEGQEWKAFNELNPVRTPFTDFCADEHLKKRPDILGRYGFSANDIDLIREWFFVDPEIVNPQTLRAMLADLGPLPAQGNSVAKGWAGIETFWDPKLLPLVLAALLLAFLRPGWRVAASWGLCIAAIFAIGLSGRPGIIRVYVPLVCLLVIAPFLTGQFSGWRNRLAAGVLIVAAIINSSLVFTESKDMKVESVQAREGLDAFPREPVVIWGIGFPLEAVYPVIGAPPPAMNFKFYGLGAFTLAPFSVAFTEQQQGRGMIDLLVKEGGIEIVALQKCIGYLGTYCRERLHGEMKELSTLHLGTIILNRYRCEAAP